MDWQDNDFVVGSFGNFSFKRRYGLANFSIQSTLATEPQNQSGGKPSTVIDGPDLQMVQFDLKLSRALHVDPDGIIKDLQALLDAQKPQSLVLGGKVLGSYRWLLKSIAVTDAVRGADGDIVCCTVSLAFEEYVRLGIRADSSDSSSSSPGIASVYDSTGSVSQNNAPGTSSEEKKEEKRIVYDVFGVPIAGKIPDAADLKRGLENMQAANLAAKMKTGSATISEFIFFKENKPTTVVPTKNNKNRGEVK